jgi:hypothetical protein
MNAPTLALLLPVAASMNLAFSAVAQESKKPPELPLASALLVEKFERYGADLRSEVEEKIRTKRDEVIAVLEKHLMEQTKAGNLDGAVAIRALLQKWESEAATTAEAKPDNKPSANVWESHLGPQDTVLKGWSYQRGENIKVEGGVLSIDTSDKKYQPILYPAGNRNLVIRATIELEHDRSIEKEQQAGVGFQLNSKQDGSNLGMVSSVIQGPEANLIYAAIGGEEGSVLAIEKDRSGIGKPTEMQFAFVDGHLLVFARKRKIHDLHDPKLVDAVVGQGILFGNNSRVKFSNVSVLVPDSEQAKLLLSGKPVE